MTRHPQAPVDDQFIQRWSPRSFQSRAIPDQDVRTIFEAARWSPSCFNAQPWRFVYATAPAGRERMVALLAEANRVWAAAAPLLGVVFARRRFEHNDKPNRWAQFDAGAASLALVLQANRLGLHAHFMGGFDAQAACRELRVPADAYEAMAAFAVGYRGEPAGLPAELQEREAPSDRLPLDAIAFADAYGGADAVS